MAEYTPIANRVLSAATSLATIAGVLGGALVVIIGFICWLSVLHSDVQSLKTQVAEQSSQIAEIRNYLLPFPPLHAPVAMKGAP